jgi:hypothetical protein
MGKLSITGTAEREVNYDAVEISITFCITENSTQAALQTLTNQSEHFLKLVTEAGVSMADIHIGENNIEHQEYEDAFDVFATREFKFRLKFNMPFINSLMALISEKNFPINLRCAYHLTNRQAIHTDLLKEALADSKAKAAEIAQVMGQKIIGIDAVKHGRSRDMDWLCHEAPNIAYKISARRTPMLSNQLTPPLTKERESIDVIWLIE